MQLSQGLALQQVLSPQMQQSLALLQAPVMELRALVEQELCQNPVLEEIPSLERTSAAEADAGATPSASTSLDPAEPPADVLFDPATEKPSADAVDDFQAKLDQLTQMDQDWREHFAQSQTVLRQPEVDDEKRQFLFDSLTEPRTLRNELDDQLRGGEVAEELVAAAEVIIGNLNEAGYLTTPLEQLAESNGLTVGVLEASLKIVQGFDPAGIGARDLRECLLLQLERRGMAESLEYLIVRDHLEALGRRRYEEIARKIGSFQGEEIFWDWIQDASENIAQLQPRPGQEMALERPEYVVPEVSVLPDGDDFRVVLNDEPLPKLRISHAYKDMLTQAGSDPEVRDYLREKMRAGKFLMRCLDQREHTIKQIAEDIVRRQKQFFREGRSQLKPMTMAQVAEVVGVHETTVSRAVAGKFMETPQGLIEMRALFTSGVATSDGGAVASTGVKELIGTMVQDEDPSAPLTDDQIEALLKAKGIKIARRTVAKYRNEMKILPVAMRRNHRHS
jgi:RNA polymerase sigma-54 factor